EKAEGTEVGEFQEPQDLDTRHALHELEKQYQQLEEKFNRLLEKRSTEALSEEKKTEIRQRSETAVSKIHMNEAETREIIDGQLRDGGWKADTAQYNYKLNKTLPEKGRNLAIAEWPAGSGWADYALFIGTELYALVEAKRYGQDISTDLRQARVYAKDIEQRDEEIILGEWNSFKVPFLFSTNGRPYLKQIEHKSGIWFLDVRKERSRSRALQGWYSPEGLQKLLEQDTEAANQKLKETAADFLQDETGLGLRDYQMQAIQAVEQRIINDPDNRRALLAMATGTGKTRTVIGLCYRLIQTNRFKRILFLVDRTMLGTQALNNFNDNKVAGLNTFAEIYEVKGLSEALPDMDTRLHLATVQSLVKRLFYNENTETRPSVDQYDCIIIDEAHRGYLLDREMDEDDMDFKDQQDYVSKYRRVLEYFDAYAIGLTATPALHTREIFGSPVFTYSYREAVIDGFLTDHEPPYTIKTRLSEEGIVWEKGAKPKAYDQETNSIVELEELEDELALEVAHFNKLVLTENFNRTVIKYLVQELDPEGDEKTLVFAVTDEHADEVVKIFKEEFEAIGVDLSDNAIEKITGKAYKPQELLNRFRNEKFPNIAVTVDLLTTGIDVPAICNLVFLRRVKSRILYEQMLGRATRKCDEIGKEVFRIYDAVRIYEALEDYTQMRPVVKNPDTSFAELAAEGERISNEDKARKQVEQVVAKLQRKVRKLSDADEQRFKYHTEDRDPGSFIDMLKHTPPRESLDKIVAMSGLWKFLDELKTPQGPRLWSDHADEFREAERGYGKGKKPEDYLQSFGEFIKTHQNKIAALNIVCTRPKELDRKSLRELKILLNEKGYSARSLNAAWKDTKNVDIAADIISYIRTMALGTALESHEDRIKRAMNGIREMKSWNRVQQKWLDRFEKQLLKETVLRKDDLDDAPFKKDGGFSRLNKIFGEELEEVMERLNEGLYGSTG
ncbi:MAG TPA: type I restriction-modification system endonuclease, partial [Cryomorphaceae bacterium]|nr:type I restriction-modification system endonuclease [Cryomorphaceae bacterium]